MKDKDKRKEGWGERTRSWRREGKKEKYTLT